MSKLSQLSARERQQIIDAFVDGVFAGTGQENPDAPAAGIARGMRQLPADLPDDPSPEQVSAWVELAELVADESFRQRARSMALAGQNAAVSAARDQAPGQAEAPGDGATPEQGRTPGDSGAPGQDGASAGTQPGYQETIEHAGQAVAAGVDPASSAGQAVLGRIVTPGTPAGQRAAILRQLETFTDARVERYWQLLAILNGQPVPPSVVPAFEWLIAALRASLGQAPGEPGPAS
jgi:hypothetical protein